MLLLRTYIFLFFTVNLLFLSCVNKNPGNVPIIIDTAILIKQFDRYDSFYKLYRKTDDVEFLKQSGGVADSVLTLSLVQIDTSLFEKYFLLLFNRAADLNDLHNFIQSRELFDKYRYLYEEYHLSNVADLAYVQMMVANIYSRYGDYKKAGLLLKQSLKNYTVVKDTESVASCILNIAIPLKEMQKYDEAVNTLQKIFELPAVSSKRRGIACIELADIYTRQNKIIDVGLQLQKAKQFLDAIPYNPDVTIVYASLNQIEGDWLMLKNDPQAALKAYYRSFDSAKVASRQQIRNRDFGKLYIAIGKALEQLNLYDSAMHYYNKALYTVTNTDTLNRFSLPLQKDLYAENTIAEALYAKANCILLSDSGNTEKLKHAANCYDLAFQTEKKLLSAFSNDESRFNSLVSFKKQTEKAIAVCYRLLQKTNDTHWAEEAFLFAESNKSFVLNESVKRNIAASLFMQEDTLYGKIQSLQSSLASIEIELNKQKFSSLPDSAIVKKLLADKQKLEEALLQNENTVKINNPQYADWLSNETALTAGEIINKIITEGSAMVEYFAGDSDVYAFGAYKDKPVSFYKLSADTKSVSNSFLHFFSDRNFILNKPAAYAAAANQLYDLLLKPLFVSNTLSLVIIPDDFISLIPFDALLTTPATSANIASFPFLIKQAEITYAFSGKTILMQQQVKHNTGNDQLIAFAPVFSNRERGFPPLSHSNEELLAIKEFYPAGKFYTGTSATLQQFKTNSTNASIIHLATHAGSGNDSSLAGIEFYDTTLYLNNIYTMPLKAKLVVLSGCETGAGNVDKTEGLMSLARGFSYAGTQNVVAGLWQTEDKTSGELFKNFYSNLSDNSISGSLQKAKLQLIQNASVSQASPFYWAGYIYIGIPGEKINTGSNKNMILIFIAGVLLLIGIAVAFKRRRQL
ncbi:MAG: CHAT domain-containing tetratricopeptide repeat protein [Ferruginibacter sp.]